MTIKKKESEARAEMAPIPHGWRDVFIRDVADVVRGGSPRPAGSPLYFNGDFLPWITVAEVTADEGMYLVSTKLKLTSEGANYTRIVESGTLLLTNSGATLGVPKITKIRAGANDGIAMLLNLRGVTENYLYYFFQTKTQYLRDVVAPGNGQPNLNTELIGGISIAVPPIEQQRRISEIISAWDNAVCEAEKLLANSQDQKQALISQVLSGKKRLKCFSKTPKRQATPHGSIPADWRYVKVEQVASEVSLKNAGLMAAPVLSCTKHAGLVDSLDYFKKQVFSKDLSTYKVVPRNCFVYATNHIEEGSIGHQDLYDAGLVSPMYTVFKTTADVDDRYLYRLLKTEHFRQIFQAATNSSVDRRGSLRWKDFKKLHLPLPPLKEQAAIASIVDAMDREIELLQKQLEALKAEKIALMQQLLTGKCRVTLSAAAAKPSPTKAKSTKPNAVKDRRK